MRKASHFTSPLPPCYLSLPAYFSPSTARAALVQAFTDPSLPTHPTPPPPTPPPPPPPPLPPPPQLLQRQGAHKALGRFLVHSVVISVALFMVHMACFTGLMTLLASLSICTKELADAGLIQVEGGAALGGGEADNWLDPGRGGGIDGVGGDRGRQLA